MSQPIPLEIPPRDPRVELQARLQNAPLEHAEALLASYEVLQGLHDRGVLELLRGSLGSSDKLIEIIVDASKSPEAVRGIRNIVILSKIMGSIDPELLESFARSLPQALAITRAHESNPPSLWGLFKQFRSKDSRRGLLLISSLLETFGKNLPRNKRAS